MQYGTRGICKKVRQVSLNFLKVGSVNRMLLKCLNSLLYFSLCEPLKQCLTGNALRQYEEQHWLSGLLPDSLLQG